MPSSVNWGEGGAQGGGSGFALGTDFEGQAGARLNVDGSRVPSEIIVGEGGCSAGGEAEISD